MIGPVIDAHVIKVVDKYGQIESNFMGSDMQRNHQVRECVAISRTTIIMSQVQSCCQKGMKQKELRVSLRRPRAKNFRNPPEPVCQRKEIIPVNQRDWITIPAFKC